jgi:hypothetical protein
MAPPCLRTCAASRPLRFEVSPPSRRAVAPRPHPWPRRACEPPRPRGRCGSKWARPPGGRSLLVHIHGPLPARNECIGRVARVLERRRRPAETWMSKRSRLRGSEGPEGRSERPARGCGQPDPRKTRTDLSGRSHIEQDCHSLPPCPARVECIGRVARVLERRRRPAETWMSKRSRLRGSEGPEGRSERPARGCGQPDPRKTRTDLSGRSRVEQDCHPWPRRACEPPRPRILAPRC